MPPSDRSQWSTDYHATYSAKDLIQYALAVGFSSDDDTKELRYTFERDASFEAVPTFCFALPSWASSTPDSQFSYIQAFPTPLMKHMGVIPKANLKGATAELLDNCPVIHMSQSIRWQQEIPVPSILIDDEGSKVQTLVSSRTLSVAPKAIGTFVETETRVRLRNGESLCTLGSTLLVLGIDQSEVIPLPMSQNSSQTRRQKMPTTPPDFEWSYRTSPNQALLYRLASGDFNAIHVDPSSTAMMVGNPDKPLLHGLCTLGIAMRGLLQMTKGEISPVALNAQFTKPVFVGDSLKLEAWSNEHSNDTVVFRVVEENSGTVVLDRGEFSFRRNPAYTMSKL
jgi:acyl dehydratase